MEPTPLQRALHQAPDLPPPEVSRPDRELFVFKLNTLLLGVDSSNVREVTRLGLLTPLPRMPSFVLGVFGHRGEVLPIVDLLRFLGQGEFKLSSRARVFLGVQGALTAAFVADMVIGLRRIFVADLLPAPVGGEIPVEHVAGIVRSEELRGAITVLNLPRVLQLASQRAVSR